MSNTSAAVLARRAYQKKWRAANKDKIKKANRLYWERRAERERAMQSKEGSE